MQMSKRFATCLLAASLAFIGACSSSNPDNNNGDPTPTPTATPTSTPQTPQVVFTPVGDALDGGLIDLEFLPGQGGQSLALTKDGRVYYLDENFSPVSGAFQILNVMDEGERGMLNVVADPDYATNRYIYLYYTVDDGDPDNPDINRLERYQVGVDVSGGTFSLSSPLNIIEFDKAQSPSPGSNHNGGALVFGVNRQLFIGVGDGGGSSSADKDEELSQRYEILLGKVHRIIPEPENGNNYTIPPDQVIPGTSTPTTVYSIGLRNPFTIVIDEDADLFLGDVGAGTFEEVNCVYFKNENYGWPHCEGPCPETVLEEFQDPIHGYPRSDETFNNQDPEENQVGGPQSIMVSAFYLGSAYDGRFTGKLIYNEFFDGWVRLLTLNAADQVTDDEHIGHQEGLTALHEHPVDGLLYGTSLFGSDRILRVDLVN